MKKYIISILLTAFTLNLVAQDIIMKAIVVYKTDGTQDSILWNGVTNSETYFYGKDNPQDNDYITLLFSMSDDYSLSYSSTLTSIGKNAPYETYGTVLSTEHIDTIPVYHYSNEGNYIYFADQQKWYHADNYQITHLPYGGWTTTSYISPANVMKYFAFMPGQTFYVRAYYILDGNAFFSSEIETHAPKTKEAVCRFSYPNYVSVNDSTIFNLDATEIINSNLDLFGKMSTYKQQLFIQYVMEQLMAMETSSLLAMATKTELCDDGTLYVIESLPSTVTDQALNEMKNEAAQPFYVQANLENVYINENNTSVDYYGTTKCTPTIVQVDEKWGIRDNQYLYTSVEGQGITAKPTLALQMKHLMQPGRTYDVTLTLAPNLHNEEDTLSTYFYVFIGDMQDNRSMPRLPSRKNAYGNDSIVSGNGMYIAKPSELKVVTMEYTPTNLTDMHVLQLCHHFNYWTAANRSTYSKDIRVVGIEVKPREE